MQLRFHTSEKRKGTHKEPDMGRHHPSSVPGQLWLGSNSSDYTCDLILIVEMKPHCPCSEPLRVEP